MPIAGVVANILPKVLFEPLQAVLIPKAESL